MSNLIDQHEVLDYCSFDDSSISSYDLSGVSLVFSGEISDPSEYHVGYIGHKADLYDHSIYEPYIFVSADRPYRDNRPKFSILEVCRVWWRHFVPFESQLAAVGYCKVKLKVFWPAPDAFPFEMNLKDGEILLETAFRAATASDPSSEGFLYPKQKEEMVRHTIKNRCWFQANHGSYSVDRRYSFYTALTSDHLLVVSLHPQGHWEPGTEPPEDILKKVFVSFWDFMDRLSIIEDKSQHSRPPGIELRGAMLERHQWEQEQKEKALNDKVSGADSGSGWLDLLD